MKKTVSIILLAAMMLSVLMCGCTVQEKKPDDAVATDTDIVDMTGAREATEINALISEDSFVLQIPDVVDEYGWIADEMAQDDSVLKLYDADVIEGTFVARYDPVGDGVMSVCLRHYTGIACDELRTWNVTVENGAVKEFVEGISRFKPAESEQDPFLSGDWADEASGEIKLNVAKGANRGWDIVITAPEYIFKTTVYYDCDLNTFVYDKGKFFNIPEDGAENLGEAFLMGTTGDIRFAGDDNAKLSWRDDDKPIAEMVFARVTAD